MSQNHNCSDNSTLAKRLQLLDQLVISFRSSLKGQDLWQATDIVNKLRKLTVDNDTRQALINSGVLKCIVKLLGPKYHSRERLMVQCSWILSNIASEDQNSVKYIVDLGAIKKGIDLLHHPNIEVKQNAVWLLANIAGESFEYRDLVIEEGAVKHVEWLLNSAAPRPSLIKHVTWLMSNLTRGRPYPNFKKVAPLLKYFAYFLNNMKKKEIIVNSLWALSYLSDGDDDQLQRVHDLQLGPKLLSLAKHADEAIQAPTIRVLGNLLAGANDEINLLIQQGILEVFSSLLNHERKIFKKDVCWGLSNILADDPDLVGQVFEFEDGRIIKRLKEIVETEPNDLGNECLYCFLNASLTGGIRQLDEMVHLGVMEMLVPKLKPEGGVETIKSCIDTLDAILDGFQENPDFGNLGRAGVIAKLKECGGFEAIENLQGHPDNGVYQTVARFIENHFSDGNDNDDDE